MKKYIFAYRFVFIATVLLGILAQGIMTAVSLFLMYLVDAIATGNMANLVTSAYLGFGAVAVFFLSLWAYTRMMALYSYKTVLKLTNDVFRAVMASSISEFNKSNSAKYISVINNDIKMVNEKYFAPVLALTKDISTMVFALGAMFFLSPVNAVIALVLTSAPLFMPMVFAKKLAATNMAHMEKLAVLNEKVKDFLSGFEVIKTFGITRNINEKFSGTANESAKAQYTASKASMDVGTFSGTVLVATQILTYIAAGYFVITGSITIGAVVAIAGLSGSITGPIQYVSLNIAHIKSSKEVREGLLKIMTPRDDDTREKTADFDCGIQIENLTYTYGSVNEPAPENKSVKPKVMMLTPKPGQSIEEALADAGIDMSKGTTINGGDLNPAEIQNILNSPEKIMEKLNKTPDAMEGAALKNISYTFKRGGKYAIVGGSGSGKSTLLRLLMGYYDNYGGNVRVGENEMRDINRERLYESLSIMHQNVFMLDDTLKNNVTLLNPYSESEYAKAIEKAQLGDFIRNLPHGSDTKIGEGGNAISGGERQRVAIARALIKGSKVLLMDEATSNLDNETAYSIEKAFIETPDTTGIFVTHRLTKDLLRHCDGILVMRGGKLAESGTFDELYQKKDYFYSLCNISER